MIHVAGLDGIFRIRMGDYRVVYRVEDSAVLVSVLHVRHRSQAYRNL